MTQSGSDIIVEFDIMKADLRAILNWLKTLPAEDEIWWIEKDTNGRTIGMSFKYPEDANIFKLRFNV